MKKLIFELIVLFFAVGFIFSVKAQPALLFNLRNVLAILFMLSGWVVQDARANVSVFATVEIIDYTNNSQAFSSVQETNTAASGTSFGVFSSINLESSVSYGDTYASYTFERSYGGGSAYDSMQISGAASYSQFVDSWFANNFKAEAFSSSYVEIGEDMMIEYFPNSATDTPPTSVSFQASYSVQGSVVDEYGTTISAGPASFYTSYDSTNPPITASLSTNFLSPIFREALNVPFGISYTLSGQANWVNENPYNDASTYDGVPGTYNLQYLPQGFVNIIDQNGQPIPTGKLLFLYVNPNDTTQQVDAPINPTSATYAVSLVAILETNSLVLQWPAYTSNYVLQMTPGLVNPTWNTNCLPAPVLNGSFLQVTVPATNACAFFRLLQTN